MVEVVSVPGVVAARMTGLDINLPVFARMCTEDGNFVGAGGLCWASGRCWLWFHVDDDKAKGHGMLAIKEARKLLKRAVQFGADEVFTPRDATYPSSERLCRLVGFEPTEEVVEGHEIWRATLRGRE